MVYLYQEETGNIRVTDTPREQSGIGEDGVSLVYNLPGNSISLGITNTLRPWLIPGETLLYRPSLLDSLDLILPCLMSGEFPVLRKLDNPGERLNEIIRSGKIIELIPADYVPESPGTIEYESDILGLLVYSGDPVLRRSEFDKIIEFLRLENEIRATVTGFFRQHGRSRREDYLRLRVDPNHLDRVLDFVPKHYRTSRTLFNGYRERTGRNQDSPVSFLNRGKIFPESTADDLTRMIYSRFKYREELLGPEIKKRLGEIYAELGISKTPKVVDLHEYFDIVPYRARGERGYRIENHLKIIF